MDPSWDMVIYADPLALQTLNPSKGHPSTWYQAQALALPIFEEPNRQASQVRFNQLFAKSTNLFLLTQ